MYSKALTHQSLVPPPFRHSGYRKQHELVDKGASIPVTNENRETFVALYVDYIMNKQPMKVRSEGGVMGFGRCTCPPPFSFLLLPPTPAQAMKALRRGFGMMCGGRALSLLNARDLHVMLCGRVDLDFAALRESTSYDGFSPTSPIIGWFWDALEKFDTEQRRQFLAFVTGSDRVPVSGLRSVKMCIQKNGPDSDRLPTSLTCFSRLLLPNYDSMERLDDRWDGCAWRIGKGPRRARPHGGNTHRVPFVSLRHIRLRKAIANAQGFGLV